MITDRGAFSGHPALGDLAIIYRTLDLPNPGPEDQTPDVFDTIPYQIDSLCKRRGEDTNTTLSDPILKLSLSPASWNKLEAVCQLLNEQYSIRYKTLVKRLDLTLTSFTWAKEGKVTLISAVIMFVITTSIS